MEEILPFLAALGYMAYKVYSNYQKGQEEAKARNPSMPYQEEEHYQEEPAYQEDNVEPFKEWWETEVLPKRSILDPEPAKYQEPKYEQTYHEPKIDRSAYKRIKSEIPKKVELYNPEIPAEEVIRGREIHAPHKHKFVASREEETIYSDFDFRDAVIKEAIMNRPQY